MMTCDNVLEMLQSGRLTLDEAKGALKALEVHRDIQRAEYDKREAEYKAHQCTVHCPPDCRW